MDPSELIELENKLRQISHKALSEWKKYVDSQFTRTEVLVLYKLQSEGSQRPSEIAQCLSITTGGLTGITDKLARGGYIQRRRDTKDRRVIYLSLTQKGKETMDSIQDARNTFIQNMFRGFTHEDLVKLYAVSEKLLANLDEMEHKQLNHADNEHYNN